MDTQTIRRDGQTDKHTKQPLGSIKIKNKRKNKNIPNSHTIILFLNNVSGNTEIFFFRPEWLKTSHWFKNLNTSIYIILHNTQDNYL